MVHSEQMPPTFPFQNNAIPVDRQCLDVHLLNGSRTGYPNSCAARIKSTNGPKGFKVHIVLGLDLRGRLALFRELNGRGAVRKEMAVDAAQWPRRDVGHPLSHHLLTLQSDAHSCHYFSLLASAFPAASDALKC